MIWIHGVKKRFALKYARGRNGGVMTCLSARELSFCCQVDYCCHLPRGLPNVVFPMKGKPDQIDYESHYNFVLVWLAD